MKTLDKIREIDKTIINLPVDERHDIRNKLCKQAGAICLAMDNREATKEYRQTNNDFYISMKEEKMPEYSKVEKSITASYLFLLDKYKLPDLLDGRY